MKSTSTNPTSLPNKHGVKAKKFQLSKNHPKQYYAVLPRADGGEKILSRQPANTATEAIQLGVAVLERAAKISGAARLMIGAPEPEPTPVPEAGPFDNEDTGPEPEEPEDVGTDKEPTSDGSSTES